MMMNDPQIGIRDKGLRSVSNFPCEIPSAKGFLSQQAFLFATKGGVTSQSLRTSDNSSSHFESRTECCLNFPGFEQHDENIPSWHQASQIGSSAFKNHGPLEIADSAERKYVTLQSRDTLQSLVQSSTPRNQNTRVSSAQDFGYDISNVPEEKVVEFQQNQQTINKFRDWSNYHGISFQKNLQVENEAIDYYQGHISPTSMSTPERAAMAKRNRIRWTPELHSQFIQCVNRLGGAKKATPKGILKLMKCEGLTIFHIKSHLQKYRVAQDIPESKEEDTEKTWITSNPELDQEMGMKILEALKMQIDVQQRLYEQLECQKELQSRIEEQAQQLKKMFDSQVETNSKPT